MIRPNWSGYDSCQKYNSMYPTCPFSFRGNGSVSDQKELQANASGDLKGVEVKYSPYVSADLTREEDL